jgi:diacylglycerol O-acyltransferase / wax synthase
MPKVGLADRIFLTADSADTPQHVATLSTFTVPPGAGDEFVRELATTMRSQATFAAPFNYRLRNQLLKKIAPAWNVLSDDQIDIDYHFRHSALPKPGGERELGVLISRLHSTPLDPSRPLWEFHLIEGLRPSEASGDREEASRFAIYMKIHHALMDGVGGSQRMDQMISPDPTSRELRPLWTIGPRPRPDRERPERSLTDRVDVLVKAGTASAQTAAALGRVAGGMIVDAVLPRNSDVGVPFAVPSSVISGRIGRQRRVATQNYDLDRLTAVAKAASVKINDVFLAISAGGLRRYLDELDALPDASLVSGTPVSIRLPRDDDAGNAFSVMIVRLGTDIADPVERIAAIARSSTVGKDKLKALPRGAVGLAPALFMGPFVAENVVGLGGRLPPPYNVSISSVPGSTEPRYLAGAELEALYPITMLYHGIALFIGAFTTAGKFGIGFTGDRDALPHLQRLAVYTGDALEELEEAFGL